ncbi:radixin-like [Camellia sinensis]|uniref:radixin-like n=1 Tax=Camellia sinensis TaxID=4442 RepID=UPI001036B147|nr:radixin-like [Camellia sinensis]
MSNESADDINVGVALSTALLLPKDLERNAGFSEYENYALMLQHSVQREVSALKKENKSLESKMKKLEDQAEAATKAQQMAEEKAESAEAIRKVAEAEKKEAEVKKAQAEKELQKALATKEAEVKEADEKAYAQGMDDVTEEYKLQVRQACNRGFSLGWMALVKKLNIPDDSPLRQADAIPLPFPPPPPPSQAEDESESEADTEDEDNNDGDALIRKPKDADETKSPPPTEQVMDLTLDEEGGEVEEVSKEAGPGQLSSDLLLAERSLDKTLAEIDAELAAEKVVEVVSQETSEVQTQTVPEAEES